MADLTVLVALQRDAGGDDEARRMVGFPDPNLHPEDVQGGPLLLVAQRRQPLGHLGAPGLQVG